MDKDNMSSLIHRNYYETADTRVMIFDDRYGTGIYMINELCEEYGIPKPDYEISKIETKRIFRSGGGAVVISEIEKSGIELNKRQSRALKYAFREGVITSKIYA